ncbi:MAG: Ig-like domain repeat protein, partial [Candidatus Poribacteria bacterium]|nr:Ig-like domain repeat protein [Candidatus Poribacteria bacterium]
GTLSSLMPLDLTADVSNIRDLLTRVEATLSDDSAEIDFDRSSIQLLNAAGGVVPGAPNNDDSTRIWWQLASPLSRNGDADALYSIRVQAFDEAGNLEDRTFMLRYDTQAPTVDSIRALQDDGTSVQISTGTDATLPLITAPINQLTVTFSDGEGSGMDLLRTTVSLVSPSGAPVGANQTDDGGGTVFLAFNSLRADGSDDGRYRVQVTPTDLAGNTFTSPIEFQFFYSTQKPDIVSTTPAEFSFVTQLTTVSAILQDHSGEGIDFDRSTIRLNAPDASEIAGRQRADEAQSTIFWELNQSLSRDGSADGQYTVSLSVFDKAGNGLAEGRTFVYDTLIPQIVSVTANTNPSTPIPAEGLAVINQSFTSVAIQLSDANARTAAVSGIDLVGTDVRLLAPGEAPVGINTRDDGSDTITVSFAQPRQRGTYTLEITPRDLAGNVSGHAIEYKFSLEFGRPSVSAVTIDEQATPVEFVNQLTEIVATLVDAGGGGLDLTTDGSTITVIGPNGEVEGDQSTRGQNQIVWRPLQIATDGSADGVYTVTVTPVDSAGRSGIPSRQQFTLDTQKPQVVSVAPIDLTQPASYVGQQITQITAQITDVGPAGLDIEAQGIQLQDAAGNVVAADLTNDGNAQIFLTLSQPLATDGSDDGTYTVVLDLTDRARNLEGIQHKLVYDTQAPRLVSTEPADGSRRSDDITVVTANLEDRGDSGIDFAVSELMLLDPNGNPINGKQNNDGRGKLTLQFSGLTVDGNYTIRVQAIDRAGNGTDAPFEAIFPFSSGIPVVVSTVPETTPAEKAFTNEPLRQVEVELQSEDGGSNRSTITLLSPTGTPVPGQQVSGEENKLIYRLFRDLASDGSDDGTYTISVTPINSAGRQGTPEQLTFLYDTVPPEVDTDTVALIVADPGVNNALNEIQVTITDDAPSSEIDWDDLDDSWLTLQKIGENRNIRGTISSDNRQIEDSRASGTLTLRLTTPLASDGSQDGEYRVTIAPRDRAGNTPEAVVYEFFYDTLPPVIDLASLFINDQPLIVDANDPDYPTPASGGSGVVIRATMRDVTPDGSRGLGVDLSQSSITVRTPDDSAIEGRLTQNGADSIEFKSSALPVEGLYQVTITSVGLDEANLGFRPTDSVSTMFLHETTKPIAELTDFGGETTLEDESLPMQGTARDPEEGEIPASGVVLVEIVGTGPDDEPIDPVVAEDESEAEEEPWSRWSLDFLPARSGEYNLDIRVTDRAGNVGVYDAVTANFSVSLSFRGAMYGWPNPLRQSNRDIAHFSFDVNIPGGQGAQITLSIYDFAGDLVYEKQFSELRAGRDNDQIVTWDLKNQSGADVARGVYIFRLEAEDTVTNNRTNAVGKLLVVE